MSDSPGTQAGDEFGELKAGSGFGFGFVCGDGHGSTGTATGTHSPLLDHERLEVYGVAREFLVLVTELIARKMPRELRDQFDRASLSILFNIGEGAGKTAKADKQRSYEIARGSTPEAAAQLDVLQIRSLITDEQYRRARGLLVRIAQMLSRLCGRRST
jgi:four helix bundle protein